MLKRIEVLRQKRINNKRYNEFEILPNNIIKVKCSNCDEWFFVDSYTWLWLHRFLWVSDSNSKYITTKINRNNFAYHTIILSAPSPWIRDHKNQNKHDNTYNNLRVISIQGNSFNMKLYSTNTSGITGVRKLDNSLWEAQLTINNTLLHKSFTNKEEAVQQRLRWEQKYHIIEEIETPKLFLPNGQISHPFPFSWYPERFLNVWWALGLQVIPWPYAFKFPDFEFYQPNQDIVKLILESMFQSSFNV